MEYIQNGGSAAMQKFVAAHMSKLEEIIEEAQVWARAREVAVAERQSDWELIKSLAKKSCGCGAGGLCQWYEAADDFLKRNAQTINRGHLAACLARIIHEGPGKNAKVPIIVGAPNSAKSTLFKPVIKVFGFQNVCHRPSEKASMALVSVTKKNKRMIFWDEARPVEYAARGTVPVGTFLCLFGGGCPQEIQVSQSFANGNPAVLWRRGACMTAKEEGLWDPIPAMSGNVPVTKEDIRHMQARMEQFSATAVVPGDLATVPDCAESFCRWLVVEAANFATGTVERPLRRLQGRALPAYPPAGTSTTAAGSASASGSVAADGSGAPRMQYTFV